MKRFAPIVSIALFMAACAFTGCSTYAPPPSAYDVGSVDQQLANDITSRLSEDSIAGRYTFGVQAHSGIITIQGAVPDETTRARVLGIVRGTPGVQSVVDRLYRM